ncbi:PIG-L deacetylase family protein [Corynebacterium breve]|uniref:PIG-L deacetylase family protein n=1 Tax=Corynebacterium breve TaxID=3049799 RepID=A0ABY8VG88_9CORY|nr:PIG-L deacetylase family protein [Corynebacterium breve]WIM68655.1 PIG-L deacetylase family protein [Corynebacterium breve]
MSTLLESLLLLLSVCGLLFFSRPKVRRFLKRNYRAPGALFRAIRIGFILTGLLAAGHLLTTHPWFLFGNVIAIIALLGMLAYVGHYSRIPQHSAPRPSSVLIVAAHPDDLEIACGSTIAKLVDSGHQVHGIIMSDGADGGDAAVRPDEARAGATFLGLSSVTVLSLTDRALDEHMNEMIDAIEAKMGAKQPDLIFTHSKNEVHQDHLAVHRAVMRAARNHHSILCFESPSVTADFSPTVFIDVTDYSDVKAEAIAAHANQSGKPYMSREIVDSITTFRGRQGRIRRAEGFEPMRLRLNDPMPL